MVRFAVNPTPKKGLGAGRFASQLALARVHPNLIALELTPGGYALARDQMHGWFELRANRGLAGYGLSRALRMLLDALAGITALEDTRTDAGKPFVHGELVPAMLRVDPTGTTRLIALAPWHWSAQATLPTAERSGHLAPERLLGDAIDARADVFSAGVLLWEALAGRRLFATDSVDTIVTRLLGEKVEMPELPPELRWAVPLKAIAMSALSVNPEQRFANCAELAEAVTAVAGAQVATHADVLNYLRLPDPVARPSLSPPPRRSRAHPSSLSALIAPVASQPQSQPVQPVQSVPVARASEASARRAGPSLWVLAATSCLLGALGVSALSRHRAAAHGPHGITELASPKSLAAPPASAIPLAPIAPIAPEAGPQVDSTAAALDPSRVEAVAPEAVAPPKVDPEDPSPEDPSLVKVAPRVVSAKPASKMPNPKVRVKGALAQPRIPAKGARGFDKAAAKYGI